MFFAKRLPGDCSFSAIDFRLVFRHVLLPFNGMLILLLFFCSGATALAYEVIWSKYLALLFGSTIQAQTVVLAVFMGGLALGNKLFSRKADAARHPLAIYGFIEIAIGLFAFLFSLLYRMADAVFTAAGTGLLEHPAWLLLLKGILSVALLLGPTILMGGTLPILAAWLQRHGPDAGRHSAQFYSINSLGAVMGAGLTGFWLIEWLGLRGTMNCSAVVNVIVGSIAIALDRTQPAAIPTEVRTGEPQPALPEPPANAASILRWGCVMVALTGAVSMGLEVLATRSLCLVFGASLQAFALVLMSFILGIGFGSGLVASPRFKHLRGEGPTIFLLLGAAVYIGIVVYKFENLATIFLWARNGLNYNPVGYAYVQILDGIIALCVLGLPAATLGSVLPLWIRTVSETSHLLGDRVGRLLTWNTLGAVGGSLLTGFLLMPGIGLRSAFLALAWILVLAAIAVALAKRRPISTMFAAGAACVLAAASLHGDDNWRYVISAGVFRENVPELWQAHVLNRTNAVHLDFYEDAPDATVSVERVKGTEEFSLRIDGKVDASSRGDAATQLLLAYLPLMARPESKDVFCFGMGSGTTAGATLQYPIEHLTVAENCEPVLRAARIFDPWNHGVLTNSRARIYHEDARTALKLGSQQYDVIISEPSNPWMIGVASVYTREFYQLAAKRLKPGGIMTQWFHTYEMDDDTVSTVLRTFASVFPVMEIWDVDDGDIVLLGSDRGWASNPKVFSKAFESENLRKDLASIGLQSPEALLARRLASQRTAFAIATPGPMHGDETPVLEYAAPRSFFIHMHNRGVFQLFRFDERTWQMDLASNEANDALGELGPPVWKLVFLSGYGSANVDIMRDLGDRYAQYTGGPAARQIASANRAMPCAFHGKTQNFPIYGPPSNATNVMTQQVVMSEFDLRAGDAAKQTNAVETVSKVLNALPGYHPGDVDWSPDYYADLAAKISLRLGNIAQAQALVRRGLQLQPESAELAYLSRVLERTAKSAGVAPK